MRVALALLCFTTAVLSRGGRGHTPRVSAQAKDEILATKDADAAYEKYLSYFEPEGRPRLMATKEAQLKEPKEGERKKVNFLKSLAAVKAHNIKFEDGKSTYKLTVNAFSVMDEEEKRKYRGTVNARKSNGTEVNLLGSQTYPDTLSWYTRGYVIESFDQKTCYSCWTFPAAALLEFALKKATGKLIELSNQELLDCTYNYDGCEIGGYYTDAWDFVKDNQHIATLAEYPYKASTGRCVYDHYTNALENNVKITGYKHVTRNSDGLMEAVQLMPLAAAIFVEGDEFEFYDSGVYEGCKHQHKRPDHAVLITGYGTNYWEIRNSWGPNWGIDGFVHFHRGNLGRGTNMCHLLDYAAHITFDNLRTNPVLLPSTKEEL